MGVEDFVADEWVAYLCVVFCGGGGPVVVGPVSAVLGELLWRLGVGLVQHVGLQLLRRMSLLFQAFRALLGFCGGDGGGSGGIIFRFRCGLDSLGLGRLRSPCLG